MFRHASAAEQPDGPVSESCAERASSVRVLLAAATVERRSTLRGALAGEADIVLAAPPAASAAELDTALHAHRPDVVVADAALPGLSLSELVASARDGDPVGRILLLAEPAHDVDPLDAIRAGAAGLLSLEHDLDRIGGAVRAIDAGEGVLSGAATARLIGHLRGSGQPAPRRTPRAPQRVALAEHEWEMLELFSRGLRADEVGTVLASSERTVRRALGQVLTKLGVARGATPGDSLG